MTLYIKKFIVIMNNWIENKKNKIVFISVILVFMIAIFPTFCINNIKKKYDSGLSQLSLNSNRKTNETKYITNKFNINYLISGFHEGLAWVEKGYGPMFGGYDVVLINKNGEIVYEVGYSKNEVIATQFYNGLSVIYKKDTSHWRTSLQGFYIINKNGKEVFRNDELYCCGRADDGIVITAKKDAGFDGVKWEIVTINNDLQLNYTGIMVDESIINSSRDIFNRKVHKDIITVSNGIYIINNMIINVNKNIKIIFPKGFSIEEVFGNWCFCFYVGSNHINRYIVPMSFFMSISNADELISTEYVIKNNGISIDGWYKDTTSLKLQFDNLLGGSILLKYSVDDISNVLKGEQSIKLCDFKGKVIKEFSKLPKGARYLKFCNSQNNKMVVYLEGADKGGYVTVYDENCEMIYSPVKISEYANIYGTNSDEYVGFGGYAFTSECIVNSKGEKVILGDDLSDLIIDSDFSHSSRFLNVFISNGYIYYKSNTANKIASLDGKNIIEEITATYDENNKLVFKKTD